MCILKPSLGGQKHVKSDTYCMLALDIINLNRNFLGFVKISPKKYQS